MDLGKVIAETAPDPTRLEVRVGKCVSVDWKQLVAQVQLVGVPQAIPVRMVGQAARPGDDIWVMLAGESAFTIGRPSRPATGTVTGSPVNAQVTVKADNDVTYTVGFSPSYVPAPGHRVLLNWDGGGHIVIRTDAADQPTVVVAAPASTGSTKSQTFYASDSGSYRSSGWQTGSVYFGQSFPSAGYFYGNQIADSIPDGATITGIRAYLEVIDASGQGTMPLSLHASASRPGGSLALDQTTSIGAMPRGFAGTIDLPNAWGDLLKTGARRGIGTSGPGYRVLRGTNAQPAAGALTIDWKE